MDECKPLGGGGRVVSLFFHYTALVGGCREEALALGAAVWFARGEDGRSGKPTATSVSFAPEAGPELIHFSDQPVPLSSL